MFQHKGMTAMEARRRGMEKPGEAKSADGMSRPSDQEEPGEDHNGSDDQGKDQGDGMHHHEMHGPMEDGSFHSVHTDPDGKKTEMDHASYSDAKDHMDQMHGETEDDGEDDGQMSHDEPDGDEPEDLASMYDNS